MKKGAFLLNFPIFMFVFHFICALRCDSDFIVITLPFSIGIAITLSSDELNVVSFALYSL